MFGVPNEWCGGGVFVRADVVWWWCVCEGWSGVVWCVCEGRCGVVCL